MSPTEQSPVNVRRSVSMLAAVFGGLFLSACTQEPEAVDRLELSEVSAELVVGESVTLTAAAMTRDGTQQVGRLIEWNSSAPDVATVTGSGVVSALAPGGALISATTAGRTATVSVTVRTPPPSTPGAPSASDATASTLVVNWSAVDGAAGYRLERSVNGGAWTEIAQPGASPFVDSNLSAATIYSYRVRACTSDGSCSAASASGEGTTAAGPSTPGEPQPEPEPEPEPPQPPPAPTTPGAPGTLTISAATTSSLTVGWAAVTGATSYRLDRRMSSGPWTEVAERGASPYTDSGLESGTTYSYRLSACNATGCSLESPTSTGVTLFAIPAAPAAPFVGSATTSSLVIGWTAAANASSFRLQRATSGSGPWTEIAQPSASPYTNAGLTASTEYHYRVRACNPGGCSEPSASSAGTTSAVAPPPPVIPAAPGAPVVGDATTSSLTVSWTAVIGATDYQLERAPGTGGPFVEIAQPSVSPYANLGLSAGTTYRYRLRACNVSGCSNPSANASGTTLPAVPATPATPAVSGATTTSLTVSWASVTRATSYRVEQAASSGGPWTEIAQPTASPFVNSGLGSGTAYHYRISACNVSGCSTTSASSMGTTLTPAPVIPAIPAAPTVGGATTTSLTASWTAVTGATSYRVERAASVGGPWTELAQPTASPYVNSGLTASTAYHYRLRACNTSGCSSTSASATGTTLAPAPVIPAIPAAPSVGGATTTSLSVSWAAVPGATSYRVESAASVGGPWTEIAQPAASPYVNSGLTGGTAYHYRLRACNTSGCSSTSASTTGTTLTPAPTIPAIPTAPTVSGATTSSLTVDWTAVAGATSYRLERAIAGGAFAEIAQPTGTTVIDNGLAAGTSHSYRLRACNASGCSTPGTPATGATLWVVPATPGAPTVSGATATSLTLGWTAGDNAVEFRVERAAAAGGPWAEIARPAASPYTNTGLTAATTHFYRLLACNPAGCSLPSAAASGTTLAAVPPP